MSVSQTLWESPKEEHLALARRSPSFPRAHFAHRVRHVLLVSRSACPERRRGSRGSREGYRWHRHSSHRAGFSLQRSRFAAAPPCGLRPPLTPPLPGAVLANKALQLTRRRWVDLRGAPGGGRPVGGSIRRAAAACGTLLHGRRAAERHVR